MNANNINSFCVQPCRSSTLQRSAYSLQIPVLFYQPNPASSAPGPPTLRLQSSTWYAQVPAPVPVPRCPTSPVTHSPCPIYCGCLYPFFTCPPLHPSNAIHQAFQIQQNLPRSALARPGSGLNNQARFKALLVRCILVSHYSWLRFVAQGLAFVHSSNPPPHGPLRPPGHETRNHQFEQPSLGYSVRAFRLMTASSSASDLFISQLIIDSPSLSPCCSTSSLPGSSENGDLNHQSLPPGLHLLRSSPTDQA